MLHAIAVTFGGCLGILLFALMLSAVGDLGRHGGGGRLAPLPQPRPPMPRDEAIRYALKRAAFIPIPVALVLLAGWIADHL